MVQKVFNRTCIDTEMISSIFHLMCRTIIEELKDRFTTTCKVPHEKTHRTSWCNGQKRSISHTMFHYTVQFLSGHQVFINSRKDTFEELTVTAELNSFTYRRFKSYIMHGLHKCVYEFNGLFRTIFDTESYKCICKTKQTKTNLSPIINTLLVFWKWLLIITVLQNVIKCHDTFDYRFTECFVVEECIFAELISDKTINVNRAEIARAVVSSKKFTAWIGSGNMIRRTIRVKIMLLNPIIE